MAGAFPVFASAGAERAAVQDGAQDETPEGRAVREAAESGKPVEVMSKRAETRQVLANPDGSFTRREFIRPAFAKVGGEWQDADATMRRRADGRVGPAAATFGLSFSGGGDAPLATMEKDGRSLSITWPKPLPEPRLDGRSAVYADVLPGVDLRIQADVDGFAQYVVVKTREAAAQPELRELTYGVKSAGADLKADGKGRLTVTAPDGTGLFSAPTPVMWDSSHEKAERTPQTAAAEPRASRAKRSVASAPAGTGDGEQPQHNGPGAEAVPSKLKEMPTRVVGDTLRIAPDAEFMKDPDTVFPVTIDPIFSGGGRNAWTIAYHKGGSLSGTSFWNGGGFSDQLARVGHEDWTNGTARSYFQMDTDGLDGAKIMSATFNVLNSYSWSCSPTPVDFGWTGPISPSTTWDNQPSWNETLQSKSFAHGWTGDGSKCKGGEGEDFDSDALKRLVQRAADGGDANLTFGLRSRSDYEGQVSSWKKFHNNPHLEVTYNRAPKVNSFAAFQGPWSPGGEDNLKVACDDDPATWPTIGRNDLTLTAKVSDPDGGQVTAAFVVWEYAGDGVLEPIAPVNSGGTAQVQVPISKLVDGKRYKWHVQARDGIESSAWTSHCGFNVDKSGPAKPTVTAVDGYKLDTPEVAARKPRKVKLESGDRFGLDGFCYTLNKPLATANTKCSNGTFVKADGNGAATITVTPGVWPQNRLHVQAYDKAGNLSPYAGQSGAETDTTLISTKEPEFVHAPDGSVHGDLPGDLDGDGYADLLATDKSGNLRFYGGKGDGSLEDGRVVDSGGWNGARIAHRGDFISATEGQTKDGYEDFIVKIGNKVYLYPGDGSGMPLTDRRKELIHPTGKQTGPLTGPGGKCVDVDNAKTDNGTAIRIHGCNGTNAQDFELSNRRLTVLGKCVDVPNGRGTNGTAVQLFDCNGGRGQEWLDRGNDSLYNPATGRCLDLPEANTADGTRLTVFDCNDGAAQRWNVPGSWQDAHQIITPGDADGAPGADLMVAEGPNMVVYSGTAEGPLAAETGTYKLKPGKLAGKSGDGLVESTVPGDVTGDGVPDILARLTPRADHNSPDYGKLALFTGARVADPKGGNRYTTVGKSIVYGNAGWDLDGVPAIASAGNVQGKVVDTGKGYRQFVPTAGQETPDFWATLPGGDNGSGILRFYPGNRTDHGDPVKIGDGAWTRDIVGIF